MLFNSFLFLFIFLPVTWVLFSVSRKMGWQVLSLHLLLVASLIFYAYWSPPFLLLLLGSITVNYMCGRRLQYKPNRFFLWGAVGLNLAVIGWYKYADFFLSSFFALLGKEWVSMGLFLPLGISFFTFQQIAWLVDSFHQRETPASFRDYALFVSFFPQLIAGPIVRSNELIGQFQRRSQVTGEELRFGLLLLAVGLFKKVVIADYFSPMVAVVFDGTTGFSGADALCAVLAYSFQIYFDFSGYSDMAIGLASLFGFRLPMNFNSPYQACSMIDFWRRWHMTLSRFLRDYLYIPLGGNRLGALRRYENLLLTMIIGGLWHGAGWSFLFWGALHGSCLVVNHLWSARGWKLPKPAGWILTFSVVVFAWIFFRASSFERAYQVIATIGVSSDSWKLETLASFNADNLLIMALVGAFFVAVALPNALSWLSERNLRCESCWCALFGGLAAASALWLMTWQTRVSEFLYFQF